jgi:hypothetical protein
MRKAMNKRTLRRSKGERSVAMLGSMAAFLSIVRVQLLRGVSS